MSMITKYAPVRLLIFRIEINSTVTRFGGEYKTEKYFRESNPNEITFCR